MFKLLIVLIITLIAFTAQAAPFLVCDPYPPETQVEKFIGILDGQPFQTPYSLHASGAAIVYDLATLDDGRHDFTEIRAANTRGQSAPVPFVLPVKPPSTLHLRLTP